MFSPLRASTLFLLLIALGACRSQERAANKELTPARQQLNQSVRYHDPGHVWGLQPVPVTWRGIRPNGDVGYSVSMSFGPGGDFAMQGTWGEHELEYEVRDDVPTSKVNGEVDVPAELRTKLNLDRDGGQMWRDYFGFLGGLPMSVDTPGALLAPKVESAELDGRAVQAIKVSFAPEVGSDIWTLYMDPETAELVGCRFDKADPTKDGETIIFEGTTRSAGVIFPSKRRWYINADRRYLGMDDLGAPRNPEQ